jgi:hypothetical protein
MQQKNFQVNLSRVIVNRVCCKGVQVQHIISLDKLNFSLVKTAEKLNFGGPDPSQDGWLSPN